MLTVHSSAFHFLPSIKQLHCDEYRDSEGESKDFHLLAVMGAEEELE